jgi:EAL domain-containing protein (putative c-di-GMP-specific phosphodiesterase class I)
VETAQQLAFLRAHDCEEGQGFHFSKALPADAFARLLVDGLPGPWSVA